MKLHIKEFFESTFIPIVFLIILILTFSIVSPLKNISDNNESGEVKDVSYNSEIDKNIQNLFENKNSAILKKDIKALESIYDVENDLGIWAYENEIRKIKYIEDWSNKQGVKFVDISPTISIKNIKNEDNKLAVSVLVSTEYKYRYKDDESVNISRVGTHHIMDIVDNEGKFQILKEWYDDPFASSMDIESYKDKDIKTFINSRSSKKIKDLSERRKKAIKYANQYAGAAGEEKYGFKYNKEYKNYDGEGGDCTNFISQILFAGGFDKDKVWNYNSDGATKTWVNAESFKQHVVYSQRGVILSSGDYKNVYKDAYDLVPGDIISYEKKGVVSHNTVVTSLDTKGYPLITCHSTDRNNVPWDIGFNDKDMKFHLIKMNY